MIFFLGKYLNFVIRKGKLYLIFGGAGKPNVPYGVRDY